jgi:hypothetical protein
LKRGDLSGKNVISSFQQQTIFGYLGLNHLVFLFFFERAYTLLWEKVKEEQASLSQNGKLGIIGTAPESLF